MAYKIVLIPGRGGRAPVPIIKREDERENGNPYSMGENRAGTGRPAGQKGGSGQGPGSAD